jgi:hypothetical protein
MKDRSIQKLVFCAAFLAALALGTPADAGFDVDFGANVQIDDDTDLFFAISSRYFSRDREVVERWGRRYDHPDDLAVALFIARHSGISLSSIFRLREEGRTWWEIGIRLGVPADVWFVPVPRDPGPPYGHAYGYWKKHKNDPRSDYILADVDVRNLVAVRVMHEYYNVDVNVAMDWRSDGRDLRALVSDEYRGRHAGDSTPPGHSKSKSKNKNDDHPGKGHKQK